MQKVTLILLMIIACFLLLPSSQAQNWEQIYTRSNPSELARAIRPLPNGYLIAGETAPASTASKGMLIQLDQRGEEVRRIFNNNPNFWASAYYDLEETLDGNFIVSGMIRDLSGLYNWYLAKYSTSGNIIWEQVYTNISSSNTLAGIFDVAITADSGFICTGYDGGEHRTIKTNALGAVEWSNLYGAAGSQSSGIAVVVMPNQSGYAILGANNLNSGKEHIITRVDLQGDTIWTRAYPNVPTTILNGDLILTTDGHFAMTANARVSANNDDLLIAKLDTANGQVVWQRYFGRSPNWDMGYAITNTLDGGLVAVGYSNISLSPNVGRVRMIKLDANGTTVWDKEHGPQGEVSPGFAVFALADSSYVVAGQTGLQSNINNAYAFKTNSSGNIYESVLSGQVYHDRDSSCSFNGNDLPFANRLIYAYKDSTTAFLGFTDSLGNYEIRIDTGTYKVVLVNSPQYSYYKHHSCVPDTIIINIPFSGSNAVVDFPQVAINSCPLVEVNMGTPFLRRCFWNTYHISYCNHGTDDAVNTDITVALDPYLVVDTNNLPTPNTILPNNTFIFSIDTISIGQCGSFSIPVYVDCDSTVLGQTHCSQVSIAPDTNCLIPVWYGPNIQLNVTCIGDSIQVVLRNIGGNMNSPLTYLVYEDNIMIRSQSFLLNAGQSQTFQIDATGTTYRIEAQQPSGFPSILGDSIVARVIERCNSLGGSSLGFVTSLPNYDGSPFLDVDCRQNIGAYDPNDKRGFPSGYGNQNYIERTTKLDYNIRFQNTGTDTAFTVVIVDTIDQALDVSTLQLGASSHSYTMSISAEDFQIITFTFNNIQLVDSNTNEPASHGFIQFSIEQKPNNPNGTIINNQAAIYFDFNPPIFTNTTLHTIGENFVQVILHTNEPNNSTEPIAVRVMPNPFQTQATLVVEGLAQQEDLQLEVYNLMGQKVDELSSTNQRFLLQRDQWPAGVYVFRVLAGGQVQTTGKFIVR